jgi:hypothetical protein
MPRVTKRKQYGGGINDLYCKRNIELLLFEKAPGYEM